MENGFQPADLTFSPENTPVMAYTVRKFSPLHLRSKVPGNESSQPTEDLYEVRVIDNDHNTYGEVMSVSMSALEIQEDEAYAIAWEVDHYGYCVVAYASLAEAEALAEVIRTIGIEVQVNPVTGISGHE